MSTSKRLDFSSPSRVGGDVDDDSDDYCAPLTRRKSLRSSASKRAASDSVVEEEPKKKKKKKMIWNEDDELTILKEEMLKEGEEENANAKSNFDGNSLDELDAAKITENKTAGKEPHDNGEAKTDADGKSLQELVDRSIPNKTAGKETHDMEAGKSNVNGNSLQVLVVDRITTENTAAAGRESDDDELCAVRDAFETMISQGLSDYQKKLQLEKLMNIDSENRKELSNEWKALCAEERKLKIKKLMFSAKLLVEAAIDG